MTDPLVAKFGSYLLMVISPRSPMSCLNFTLKKIFHVRKNLNLASPLDEVYVWHAQSANQKLKIPS